MNRKVFFRKAKRKIWILHGKMHAKKRRRGEIRPVFTLFAALRPMPFFSTCQACSLGSLRLTQFFLQNKEIFKKILTRAFLVLRQPLLRPEERVPTIQTWAQSTQHYQLHQALIIMVISSCSAVSTQRVTRNQIPLRISPHWFLTPQAFPAMTINRQ